MSRDIPWEGLSTRLAQLAGRSPLPSGRTLRVIRTILTLERRWIWIGAQPRAFVFVEDELNSVKIRTGEDVIVVEVQQCSFMVPRADFTCAVETKRQGRCVEVEISLAPNLAVDLSFEHFEGLQANE